MAEPAVINSIPFQKIFDKDAPHAGRATEMRQNRIISKAMSRSIEN